MKLLSLFSRNRFLILAFGIVALGGRAFGDNFSDDMTAPTGLSSAWGADAAASWPEGSGGVSHVVDGAKIDFVLPYKAITLPTAFTASVDVRIDDQPPTGAHWAGIAYNIQDAKNFYVFRMSVKGSTALYQVLKCVNGEWKGISPTDSDFKEFEAHDGFYTMQVTVKSDGTYNYSISSGTTKLVDLPSVPDPNGSLFSGGNAGLYAGSSSSTLADFRLQTTPDAPLAKSK